MFVVEPAQYRRFPLHGAARLWVSRSWEPIPPIAGRGLEGWGWGPGGMAPRKDYVPIPEGSLHLTRTRTLTPTLALGPTLTSLTLTLTSKGVRPHAIRVRVPTCDLQGRAGLQPWAARGVGFVTMLSIGWGGSTPNIAPRAPNIASTTFP